MASHSPVRFLDSSTPPHVATLILLAGIAALSMSVFLPSLNAMALYFNVDYAVMQLAVSGYLGTVAVVQLIVGPISDRYGRRPVILAALVLFCLATVGCIFAPNATVFLICRMAQAVIATLMTLSRAIVRDLYPPAKAASVIGYVTMGMALVPMLGPMIGGLLDQMLGWKASFGLLLVLGCGMFALVIADQGETVAGQGTSFGEQVRTYPELLRSQRFWGYVACTAFGSGAFFALLGGASFVAQELYGLSAAWTGIALGTPAVGYAIGNGLAGRYTETVGLNRMVLLGSGITFAGMGLGLWLVLLFPAAPLAFFAPCVLMGLGNGIMLPNATAGTLSVRPKLAGTASGLGGAIMLGGGALLSAGAGAVLTEDRSALPLQLIMFLSSAAGLAAILWVIRRERVLSAFDSQT